MVGPARPSRTGLRAGLGVLAAIGLLLVAGRLSAPAPQPDAGVGAAPQQLLGGGVDFTEPISGLVANRAALWVGHDTTIERLDPRTLRVTATVELPASATLVTSGRLTPIRGLAASAAGDAIWVSVANSAAGLVRIDAASARVVATLPVVGVGPAAVSSSGSAAGVWVVCCGGETFLGPSRLVRVDPVSNRVVAKVTIPHGLSGTRGSVLVGHDAVWVSDPASRTVVRIDPRSNRVAGRTEVGGSPLAATAEGTVLAASGGRVLGLGRRTVRSAQVEGLIGDYATALAVVGDTIWVAETNSLLSLDRRELH